LIIKKDVIIYQGRKIKIRDYRKKIIQYPSFPYSSKVYVFYALHMQRERERVLGSALFGMVKRNYKDNANQKAKA
jgi:hypothetical protein